jgi:AcrR family transcriptional regulator
MPDPAATRARILSAASRLFYERGINAVGVNEIAAVAGASKLSLYKYFPSKHALVEAMLSEMSDGTHEKLREAAEGASPLAVVDLVLATLGRPDFRGCPIVNGATDTRDDASTVAIARRHLARYRTLLEESLGDVPDRAGLARRLLLLIEGAATVMAIDRTTDAARDARAAAEVLLSAVPPR